MSNTNILPVPAHFKVLSETEFLTRNVIREQGLDEILTSAEQHRFRRELDSDAFKNEGYVLRTRKNGAYIYAPSDAGFFYGRNTAKRLITANESKVLDVLIVDKPAFPIGALWKVLPASHGQPIENL